MFLSALCTCVCVVRVVTSLRRLILHGLLLLPLLTLLVVELVVSGHVEAALAVRGAGRPERVRQYAGNVYTALDGGSGPTEVRVT